MVYNAPEGLNSYYSYSSFLKNYNFCQVFIFKTSRQFNFIYSHKDLWSCDYWELSEYGVIWLLLGCCASKRRLIVQAFATSAKCRALIKHSLSIFAIDSGLFMSFLFSIKTISSCDCPVAGFLSLLWWLTRLLYLRLRIAAGMIQIFLDWVF